MGISFILKTLVSNKKHLQRSFSKSSFNFKDGNAPIIGHVPIRSHMPIRGHVIMRGHVPVRGHVPIGGHVHTRAPR